METRHIATQVIGMTLALASVTWAIREARRDKRIPLVDSPFSRSHLALIVGHVLLWVATTSIIFGFRLVPLRAPSVYMLTLGWLIFMFVALMVATTAVLTRRTAVGWITFDGHNTLTILRGQTDLALLLSPGNVQAWNVAPGDRAELQFLITSGPHKIYLWGMVGIRNLRLATANGLVEPRGLTLGSNGPLFCNWIRPFIAEPSIG